MAVGQKAELTRPCATEDLIVFANASGSRAASSGATRSVSRSASHEDGIRRATVEPGLPPTASAAAPPRRHTLAEIG
ncbi:MAG: hypothetical protein EA355_09535 [Rhodobacteraceae bacterium]|nr:MAG: hypothetical protein EA355_09535 [Paracoccaceae bacterium]